MASFTLDGVTYEYLVPDPGHDAGSTHSWTYGQYPKAMATLALVGGRSVDVYANAQRWNPSHVLVSWADDDWRPHWSWVVDANRK